MALSYAWGGPRDTLPLEVNGNVFQITPNLDSALRQLSRMTDRLVIWADSICINQADLSERANQVKMMGEIYQNAEHVLVWLGEEFEDNDLAMDMIKKWGEAYEELESTKLVLESINDPFEERSMVRRSSTRQALVGKTLDCSGSNSRTSHNRYLRCSTNAIS